jgi:hypothetical protein
VDFSSLPPYQGLADPGPSQQERLADGDRVRADAWERALTWVLGGLLVLGILLFLLYFVMAGALFYPQLA